MMYQEEDSEIKMLKHHPLTGLDGAGIMLQFLRKQFHSFLKAASNVMPIVSQSVSHDRGTRTH